MSAVLTREDVMEISRRIDEILEILRIQNRILCQLLPQSAKLDSQLRDLSCLSNKLDSIDKSISTIKEFVTFR